MTPSLAVVGTGRMGAALARAFLAQGYRTHIWNRTASKTAPLAALGAHVAATLRDAVDAADVVVVNVRDAATCDALLHAPDVAGALRGKQLVQLTSGTPAQARALAEWAEAHGVPVLEGAVMVTPNLVGTPQGTVLYAGPRALFETWQPVLRALGDNARYVGDDPGRAAALDLALLSFFWGALFGALQGAAVCAAEQVPLDAFGGYLRALTPVVEGSATGLVQRIADGRFASDATTWATVATHHAGVRQLLEVCTQHGLEPAVPAAFHRLLQAAVDAGHGDDGFAVLSTLVQRAPTD